MQASLLACHMVPRYLNVNVIMCAYKCSGRSPLCVTTEAILYAPLLVQMVHQFPNVYVCVHMRACRCSGRRPLCVTIRASLCALRMEMPVASSSTTGTGGVETRA
eukprot:scaffold77285_cov22-Tisochrysis_lutea.AAC.3